MSPDELDKPLSQAPARAASRRRIPVLALIVALLSAVVLTALGWAIVVEDPLGGEPMATATIEKPAAAADAQAPESGGTTAGTSSSGDQTVTIIDGKSGARKEVPVGDGTSDTSVGPASHLDSRLIEDSAHGPIPRVGPDGTRPLDVYSRANASGAARKGPRVALILTGLGISESATAESIARLPAPITFAFAPHTAGLTQWAAKAREAGHEFLLQLPMEPFDYPDNDPGPQTLLIKLPKEQNIDRLHWFLSRAHGYIGVASYMGARFTSNEAALTPILAELATRGLLYLDDGSSTRSIGQKAAEAANAPFIKADVVIDARPNWSDIDTALEKLERLAMERSYAVGVASALPVSIERIARWAKNVEARGIRIVPLTAIAVRARQS